MPSGYNENIPLGRPKEKASNINTQQNVFGRDRLGKQDMKNDDQPGYNSKALTENVYLKNKQFLIEIEKKLVFQSDKANESLLDESQLRD